MELKENNISVLEKLSGKEKLLSENELNKSLSRNLKESSTCVGEEADGISFMGSQETQRDLDSSKLQTELSSCGIYISGSIYSDRLWGGLDAYSGRLVHDKINEARNSNRITDSQYEKLISMLKKACYHQN